MRHRRSPAAAVRPLSRSAPLGVALVSYLRGAYFAAQGSFEAQNLTVRSRHLDYQVTLQRRPLMTLGHVYRLAPRLEHLRCQPLTPVQS